MKSIEHLETDNPQVALIVAAHNAVAMDWKFGLSATTGQLSSNYKTFTDAYAERFAAVYRQLAEAAGLIQSEASPAGAQ